jgi:hypothetical protein
MKMANRTFENVSQFKYLGMTVTNQNLIEEEIKRRLNFANACYHSVLLLAVKKHKNQKNCVFWDVMPRGSCKNRRFGGT